VDGLVLDYLQLGLCLLIGTEYSLYLLLFFCSISFGINLKSISDLGVALKSMEILLQEVSFHLNSSKNLRDSLTTLLNVEE